MAFIPVPDCWQVEIRMLAAGQKIENTLYFVPQVDAADPSIENLGAQILLWWNEQIKPLLPDAVSLREIYVTDLSSASGGTHTQPAPVPVPVGGKTSPMLPNNASLCVSFRTGNRGRSFRGRNYFAGLTEIDVTLSTVASGLTAQIVSVYNDLLNSPVATDFVWVVVSRYTNNAPRVTGVATPVRAVLVVDDVVDSMRRRLPNRGS